MGPGDRQNPLSRYTIYVTPSAMREIKGLPGSEALSLPDMDFDVWRLRLDKWRIVYAITEADKIIDVLAVRRRPPYDYGDLEKLLADL